MSRTELAERVKLAFQESQATAIEQMEILRKGHYIAWKKCYGNISAPALWHELNDNSQLRLR